MLAHSTSKTFKTLLTVAALSLSASLFATVKHEVTIIESKAKAEEIYSDLRSDDRPVSQCFYRAHTWCRQMDTQCNVKSSKIFIFYTPRYQKEVDGKWWFHVAPMVHVKGENGKVTEYIFDKTFNVNVNQDGKDAPTTAEQWTKHFSHGRPCKIMDNFQEFLNEREKPISSQAFCFIRKTPMYNWSPADIESGDCANPPRSRNQWDYNELKKSEKAFGTGNRVGYFFERVLGL
jgi:hypothetical protein